ncbi:hypothetical protein Pfo_016776 [Paulownia fortunei]|nr:hypothetical protein Pfo_016776 [Paulownia fortunei]
MHSCFSSSSVPQHIPLTPTPTRTPTPHPPPPPHQPTHQKSTVYRWSHFLELLCHQSSLKHTNSQSNCHHYGSLYMTPISASLDWTNYTKDGGLSFCVKLMMLKQSPSRNLRAKRLKVKHALQIFVLIAVCIWLLYQVKQSYNKKGALEERPAQVSEYGENEYQILKTGRKHLKPRLDEFAAEFEKHGDEEAELEDEESKVRDNEGEENIDRDEETDAGDKEKSEEAEHDQLQDFIDEDDKDR